jgi:hypothetical protein
MPFAMFHQFFSEVAREETRSITILQDFDWDLPAESYGFFEMFCDEPGCDCRRVFLCVISERMKNIEAYIGYGWESRAYYRKWLRFDDPHAISELQGPILNAGSPQSPLAPALLRLFQEVLLKDTAYIERIKRHYDLFRARIDSGPRIKTPSAHPRKKRQKS